MSLSSSNSLESYFAIWELIVSDTPDSRTASFPCKYEIVKRLLERALFTKGLVIKFKIHWKDLMDLDYINAVRKIQFHQSLTFVNNQNSFSVSLNIVKLFQNVIFNGCQ